MTPFRLIALLALLAPPVLTQLFGSLALAQGQQPGTPGTQGTLMLRGVVATAANVPLPRVHVGIVTGRSQALASAGVPLSEQGVLTDDRGLFTIRVPAATSVRLAFTKARYVAQTAVIPLRDADRPPEMRVRMSLAGAISGRVSDRSGLPLMGTTVTLQPPGTDQFDPAVVMTTTNDIGEYRFGGLSEGPYVVTARPSVFALSVNSNRVALTDAAAVQTPVINVSAGAEVANLNLTIDTPSELDREAVTEPDSGADATASMSGRIVGWDGQPIARAVVQAFRPFVSSHAVETDARGRYRFDRLSPGDYTVKARKYGFNEDQYRLDGAPSTGRFTLGRNQALEVDVMLARGTSITGTIVDEFGEPAQDVIVHALPIQLIAGRTSALRVMTRGRGSSRTDDRGQYRVSGLQPGTYVVQAVVGDTLSSTSGYLPLFYPGTQSIDQATTTRIDFKTAATGIDLRLIASPAYTVTGRVFDASGKPPFRGDVTLSVSQRSGAIQTDPVRTNTNPDGSFEFRIGPGDYVVQVNSSIANSGPNFTERMPPQFGMSYVTVVASDPPRVELRMTQGATLAGRVRYEGRPATAPLPILALQTLPTDHDRAPIRGNLSAVFADNGFVVSGVFGPTLIRAQPQQNDWYVKSVIVQGQEVVDTPFDFGAGGTFRDIEVVISVFGATVNGHVTDDRGAPVHDSSVVVFSTSRDRWGEGTRWVKRGQSSENGAFTLTGLPAGDYWVAAVPRLDRTADIVPDADLLEALTSRALRVSLGEGQSQDLALRLLPR